MTEPRRRNGWQRLNWGVAAVLLLAVNVVLDLVLGRHGVTGTEAVALAALWGAWWVLVAVTLAAALVRARRGR